ncbi:hypothetical protein ACJJJB_18945 [Microbulbifer sp. ANSA001]|uniref:hypothetical protein n=1 Tax=Microbulbifer TaxID=48073 RepID=UPI0003629276|nr:hypothetical protein [Microbulbifer variabilis]
MRYQALFIIYMLIAGCSGNKTSPYVEYIDQSVSIPVDTSIAIKVEAFKKPPFYGQVNHDSLDVNHGQMTYIGATPAAFAGSILAHALIVGATGDSKKKAEQERADKILEPYKENIAAFNAVDLIEISKVDLQKKNIPFIAWEAETNHPWVVQSHPVFFLSQDRSTLTLKNAVSITELDNQEKPAYQNLIEVVSSPNKDKKIIPIDSLGELSIKLFVDSLMAMKAELSENRKPENKEMTLSFFSGGEKVYERGRIISEECNRMTFRTLRGWVKSVPTIAKEPSPVCLES